MNILGESRKNRMQRRKSGKKNCTKQSLHWGKINNHALNTAPTAGQRLTFLITIIYPKKLQFLKNLKITFFKGGKHLTGEYKTKVINVLNFEWNNWLQLVNLLHSKRGQKKNDFRPTLGPLLLRLDSERMLQAQHTNFWQKKKLSQTQVRNFEFFFAKI